MGSHRRALALAWLAIAALTTVLIVGNAREAIRRYRALDSGWSWDLAYYNQWFWSLTQGDGRITVRPVATYAQEDLSVWRSNYLAPIRLAIAPIYALRPGPETLLVVEAVLLWMVVPAAFVLARGESGSILVGLASACLVPLTPLLVPIAANDFRELQLAIPFVVLAVEGMRGRRRWLATAGIVGMLACRQEYAVLVASLGLIPPREPEDLGRTARWARADLLCGCRLVAGLPALSRACPELWDSDGVPPAVRRREAAVAGRPAGGGGAHPPRPGRVVGHAGRPAPDVACGLPVGLVRRQGRLDDRRGGHRVLVERPLHGPAGRHRHRDRSRRALPLGTADRSAGVAARRDRRAARHPRRRGPGTLRGEGRDGVAVSLRPARNLPGRGGRVASLDRARRPGRRGPHELPSGGAALVAEDAEELPHDHGPAVRVPPARPRLPVGLRPADGAGPGLVDGTGIRGRPSG